MKPLHHAAASTCFAAGTWAVTGSPALALANFAAGTLIDLDHLPEFLIKTHFKENLFTILKTELHRLSRKSWLLFHGFDLAALVCLTLCLLGKPALSLALAIGFLQHLILDTWYNPVKTRWAYFLIYRIRNKFESAALFHQLDVADWRKKRHTLTKKS